MIVCGEREISNRRGGDTVLGDQVQCEVARFRDDDDGLFGR
jgi:hypothetical protein